MTVAECEEKYRSFLSNTNEFEGALKALIEEWPVSCEHYLTNEKMNRIAWLGQASMCFKHGISSRFCGGYNMLTDEEKNEADKKAHEYLNIWLERNGRETLSFNDSKSKSKSNIY